MRHAQLFKLSAAFPVGDKPLDQERPTLINVPTEHMPTYVVLTKKTVAEEVAHTQAIVTASNALTAS